jgi:hypothetical protein
MDEVYGQSMSQFGSLLKVARNRSPKNGWFFFTNTGHKKTEIKHGLRWFAENSPFSSMFFPSKPPFIISIYGALLCS